jgi:hypothetical protein
MGQWEMMIAGWLVTHLQGWRCDTEWWNHRFLKMDHDAENVLTASPSRPLTDDEHQLLRAWIAATEVFSAFVSQRQDDDPTMCGRIIVLRRITKRHLYLIHCPEGSSRCIVFSADERENLGYFPTLRAALDYISPGALPGRMAGSSSTEQNSVVPSERALRDAQMTIWNLRNRLDATEQGLRTAQAELAAERHTRLEAEKAVRQATADPAERNAGGDRCSTVAGEGSS